MLSSYRRRRPEEKERGKVTRDSYANLRRGEITNASYSLCAAPTGKESARTEKRKKEKYLVGADDLTVDGGYHAKFFCGNSMSRKTPRGQKRKGGGKKNPVIRGPAPEQARWQGRWTASVHLRVGGLDPRAFCQKRGRRARFSKE